MVMITSTRDRDLGRRTVGGAVSFDDIALADEVEARARGGAASRPGAFADKWAGAAGSFGDSFSGAPYAGGYPSASASTASTPVATSVTPAATPSRSELIAIYWQAHRGTPSTIIQGMRDFGVSVAEFAAATGQSVDALGRYLQAGGAEDGFGGWFAPVVVAATPVATPAASPAATAATPSRAEIITSYWQAYSATPSTIIDGMRAYGVSVAEFAAATGQSVDALGRYLQAGGAENGFGGWYAPVVTAATTVTSTRSAEHNALILVFWEANKNSVKTISDAMTEFKVSAAELAFATGQTLEQVERYLREGAAAAASSITTITTAATDQSGASHGTTQRAGSTASQELGAQAYGTTTTTEVVTGQLKTDAATTDAKAPVSQLTPDQLTRVANYWTEHQADPYRIMQSMVEHQVSATDLAAATGQSVQDVADYLSRNGAPAGFAGSDCVDRKQVDLAFLGALNSAAMATPREGRGVTPHLHIGWSKVWHGGHNGDAGGYGYVFSVAAFTAWYTSQDTAQARAFAQLHGMGFSKSGATVQAGHWQSGERSNHWVAARVVWGETQLQAGARIQAYLGYAKADATETAAMELMLSEPGSQELLVNFGGSASLPETEQGERMRARFGSERATDLYRLAHAGDEVREVYIQAFKAGTVYVDLQAFTIWYAEQDTPASRTFKQLYGSTVTAEEKSSTQIGESGEQTNTWIESYIGDGAFFVTGGQVDATLHASGRNGLVKVDLANPPELLDPGLVLFDPVMGFVTPLENIKPEEPDFFDQFAPILMGAVMGYFLGPIGAQAMGFSTTGVVAAGLGSAISSSVTNLATNGTIDFEDVLTGALTAMLTAGVSDALGLDKMGYSLKADGSFVLVDGQKVVSDWALRAVAVTAKASFSGFVSGLTGGKFATGFTAVIANSLVGSVVEALNAQINANTDLSPLQRSALRTFASALGSAIKIIGTPGDPRMALATAFMNDLLGSIDPTPSTDTTVITQVAFDDDGNLMPGIVNPDLKPEQQALQLSALLVSQGFSLEQANALAFEAIGREIESASAEPAYAGPAESPAELEARLAEVDRRLNEDLAAQIARDESLETLDPTQTGGANNRVGDIRISVNQGMARAMDLASDPFGLLEPMIGLSADLRSMQTMQAESKLGEMREAMRKAGVPDVPEGYSQAIGSDGRVVRDYGATADRLTAVYEDHIRDVRMRETYGDDYKNLRIGSSQMTPAQFEQKVLTLQQDSVDRAYEKGRQAIANGLLKIEGGDYARTLGNFVDKEVRFEMRGFARQEGIPDSSASTIWAINRQIKGDVGIGIPDGRIGLNLYHDTTLAQKSGFTAQLQKWNAIQPGHVLIVRPSALGGSYVVPQNSIPPYVAKPGKGI